MPASAPKGKTGMAGKPVTTRPMATAAPTTTKPGLGKPSTAVSSGRTASPSKANGAAGVSTQAAGDDDKTIVTEMLTAILLENGPSIAKKELSKLLFQKASEMVKDGQIESKAKTKLVQLGFQDAFLHSLVGEGAIQYDGATLSLPE